MKFKFVDRFKNTHLKRLNFNLPIMNHRGMSLIEVIVVSAIMGVTMLAMMTIQDNQLKSNNYLEFQLKRVQLQNALVGQVFNDPNNCACLFNGATSFPATPAAPGVTLAGVAPTQIGKYNFVTPGVCGTATMPQPLVSNAGLDGLKTTSIQLTKIQNISGSYSGEVVINLQSIKPVSGPSDLPIRIPVNVTTSPAGANVNFVSCSIASTSVPQAGGILCGLYSSTGGATITCGGMNPNVGCPAGYRRQVICDDNKSGCGQVHVTCVTSSDVSSPALSLASGTLCGFRSSNPLPGSPSSGGPFPSPEVPTLTVASACNGSTPTSGGGCPAGFSHHVTCDDNGSGCGQHHYFCASSSTSTGTPSPGTLCGLYSTIIDGKYAGIISAILCQGMNPVNECPSGYTRIAFCDDNGYNCGQGYFTCRKN